MYYVGDFLFSFQLLNKLLGGIMKIGYARISTQDQNFDLQIDALKNEGCEKIIRDTMSGAKEERDGLKELFKILRKGDTLVVWRLDRLGRSLKHLMSSTFYNDLALLESEGAGGALVSDITINGYPATKILGTSYISSIKNFMFVQVDPVAIITFTGVAVQSDTITVDGKVFTAEATPVVGTDYDIEGDAALQATEVAAVLDLELGNEYVITTA